MNQDIIKALKVIYERIKNKKIKWVIGGSTSLVLQDIIRKKPKDIDIITTKGDSLKLNKIFKEFEITPVKFSKSKKIKSWWGKLKINNVEIDIIGELSERYKNKWINISHERLKDYKIKKIENMKIPVTDLEQHLKSYKILKRRKDIQKIKKIEEALSKK